MRALLRELCAVVALVAFVAGIGAGGSVVDYLRRAQGSAIVAEIR